MRRILKDFLPDDNLDLLRRLVSVLLEVASSPAAQMPPPALGHVFAPLLLGQSGSEDGARVQAGIVASFIKGFGVIFEVTIRA